MAKRRFDGPAPTESPTEFSAFDEKPAFAEKPQATKELTVVPEPPKTEVVKVVETQPAKPLVQEHVRAHFEFHRETLLAGLARKRGLGTLRD